MTKAIPYAILDSEGRCINRISWNGQTDWQPPDGCTAVADLDGLYQIYVEIKNPINFLDSLTEEQKAELLFLLQT